MYEEELFEAIENNNIEKVKNIVESEVPVVDAECINKALSIAAKQKYWELVKYLIEKGADVNTKAEYERETALILASEKENLEMVKYLIEHGANNINDALRIASNKGNLEIVKYLVEKGASNINQALTVALEEKDLELIKYLIEHGANVDYDYDNKVKTALIIASEKGNFDMVKYLVENGADVNAKGKYGYTTLGTASEKGYLEIVKYLVEKRADINAKDNNHWSALMYASTMGYSQIVKYLIEKGADKETESGNSQEPKLTQKYLFATLKGKIDNKYDITMNIKISGVSYSWTGEISGQVSGNYHYDIFERGINFSGYIDENSMVIEAEGDEVFNFKLDEETLKKILEFKNTTENITINGTWEYKSKSFPCVINSVSPLGGKLSEIFEYNISNDKYDYVKNILYSPSINVSYFGNDTENIDIKNFKNIYERKLKKVVNNEVYTYSRCSSHFAYFDNKILCIKDTLDSINYEGFLSSLENKESEDSVDSSYTSYTYYYDYNIISLETGKKLNNTLEDLVDYDAIFIEFLTKEYKDDFKATMEFINRINDILKDSGMPGSEQSNDFNFPEDFDLPKEVSKSKFIFNNDGTITIYNDWLPTITKGYSSNLSIEMKKLKLYIKKDSFYRYLFD